MKAFPFFWAWILHKENHSWKWQRNFIKYIIQFASKYTSVYNLKHNYSIYASIVIVFFEFEILHEVIWRYLQYELTYLRRCVFKVLFDAVMRWMYTCLLQNAPVENYWWTLTKDLHPGFCPERAPCCFCSPLSVALCVSPGNLLHVNTDSVLRSLLTA